MNRHSFAHFLLGSAIFIVAGPAQAEDSTQLDNIISEGRLIADIRVRYEGVDQDGLTNNADALTARARLGFETGSFHGLRLLTDIETVHHLGGDDFNDTLNGKTSFPVVADPESTQLNRLQLRYQNDSWLDAIVGRQRIKLDNDRFIGNVGFRQNEQTFDAVRLDISPVEDLVGRYIYLSQVNRIFGEDSSVGRFDLEGHLLNVSYDVGPLDLVGYGYFIENEDAPALTSETLGLRLRAESLLDADVSAGYGAEIAYQSDYENQPANFSHLYYAVDGNLSWSGFTFGVAYEVLEGDGTTAFQTPYATGHKFQGFADVFLTTPSGGIEDVSATMKYAMTLDGWVQKVGGFVTYHDFSAETGGLDYGREIDLGLFAKLQHSFSLEAKYANYQTDGFATDRNKVWLTANYSY